MQNVAPIIAGYDTRLDRGMISGANFGLRRWYFWAFRERHLPNIEDIPQEGDIVDAGCYTGSKMRSLLNRYSGRCIRGIDINERALALARERFTDTEVRFEQGDIRNLSDSVSGAALVFSSQVFHHLQKVDRLQALQSIHESLRISGKLVISDTFLDVANPFYRLLIAYYERIAQCPYAIVMPDNLIEEARSIGFKLNRVHHTIPGARLGKKLGMYPSSMLTFVK